MENPPSAAQARGHRLQRSCAPSLRHFHWLTFAMNEPGLHLWFALKRMANAEARLLPACPRPRSQSFFLDMFCHGLFVLFMPEGARRDREGFHPNWK